MSQAGEIDVIGNNPEIPTLFIADVGSAVPIANTLEILGTSVAAGTTPVETTGSGNTITVEVQTAQEIAATDATKIGLAAFDSAGFDVDANGFVTLTGGGGAATNIDVDAHTAPGTDPVVPNAGNIIMTGAQVASGVVGTNVIRTDSLAANTVTIEIQRSTAVAATDITKNGVSHFNSNAFSVDANGFVSLAGGGQAIDSIGTQTGTNPIVPTAAGLVTINGAVVAAGTNPVRSDGTGANTMAIEVQISQALAATDATKIGLANFDSAAFDVDANGFVQLNGGGIAATSFDVQANTAPGTDPVVPTAAGSVTVNGAAVANHSVVLETRSRAANAYNLEIQYATSAAATDATKSGVAHFDSAAFSVDANGFVQLAGGGLAIDSIHPDSGTDPVVPTAAGLVNIVGSGSTTTVGSLNTLTIQLTGLTNHAVLVGAGTSTITKVGPTATAGQVLQSAGAAADPAFSTATYPSTTTVSQILYSSATNTVTGLATANRGVLTTGATGVPVITALATDGQLIIGSTAGAPAAASLTSSDSSVTITPGSNSISLTVTGGTTVGKTITGDTGGALSPTSGNWNITGQGTPNTTGIQTTGSGSTLNVQMFSPFALGSFSFSRSASGANNTLTIENTSNTASSNALEQITVAGTSAGDPFQTFTVSGTTNWSQGIDNSVSDNFVLAASTALGTTNVMSATTAGAVSYVLGNVDVTRSASGADVSLTASNTSNTASSSATLYATAAGTSAGDARTQYAVSGTTTWTQGIDNSVTGDPFVIAASSALGTTNIMSAATTGEINYPLQPAFLASNSLASNVTGDGTTYTMIYGNEIYDQNGDFDGTSTFTAPVTGRYLFCCSVVLGELGAAFTSGGLRIVASNRVITGDQSNYGAERNAANIKTTTISHMVDMDAADTCTIDITVTGSTKTVDTNANGYFSGYLLC